MLALAALGVCASCGGRSDASSTPASPSPFVRLFAAGDSAALVGAGDIARCGTPGAERTAALLDRLSGTVFVVGDNAYMDGSAAEYRDCYHPTWGRHRGRTRPVPGNHEYQTPGAFGYFEYFGSSAGTAGRGYYSYTLGPWFVLALNSEVPLGAGSGQLQWVRDQLVANPSPCTLVYWHRPLFSSGRNGPNRDMLDLWRLLYSLDVDVVVNAHDHIYERFAPQNPDGQPDPVKGIRQFTVGTGGAAPYEASRLSANSELTASVWGVVSFTLRTDGYSWEFHPADGFAFRDAGSGGCH